MLLKEDLGRNNWPMTRFVKIELNGAVGSVELRTVDSLCNQKLFRRPINKILLLVENEIFQFRIEETNKGQNDMIT